MRKPKIAAEIGKQLRRFHQVEIPGSKEPQLWNDISKFYGKGLFANIQIIKFNIYLPTQDRIVWPTYPDWGGILFYSK